jgi:hypothetical protein
MSRAIALFGSSRRHGNTGQFMDRIAADAGIEVVDLGTRAISPFDYEHRNRGDDFEPLMMRALEHDAIVRSWIAHVGTPAALHTVGNLRQICAGKH